MVLGYIGFASVLFGAAASGQHRHQRQRDCERKQQRVGDGQRLIFEQLAGDAGDEHHREEHGHRGQRRRGHSGRNLARAQLRRFST